MPLFNQDNIEGVKVALGSNEENIAESFAANIVSVLESTLTRYKNVKITGINFSESGNGVDVESDDDQNMQSLLQTLGSGENFDESVYSIGQNWQDSIKGNEEIIADDNHMALAVKLDDYIFDITAERGVVDNIVVKDEGVLNTIIDIMENAENELLKFPRTDEFDVILRKKLERNFVIRYIDANGKLKEQEEID